MTTERKPPRRLSHDELFAINDYLTEHPIEVAEPNIDDILSHLESTGIAGLTEHHGREAAKRAKIELTARRRPSNGVVFSELFIRTRKLEQEVAALKTLAADQREDQREEIVALESRFDAKNRVLIAELYKLRTDVDELKNARN